MAVDVETDGVITMGCNGLRSTQRARMGAIQRRCRNTDGR